MEHMNYVVVMTVDDGQVSASVPDLPGVFATGDTHDEAQANIREAIRLYVDELRRSQAALPKAQTTIAIMEVNA